IYVIVRRHLKRVIVRRQQRVMRREAGRVGHVTNFVPCVVKLVRPGVGRNSDGIVERFWSRRFKDGIVVEARRVYCNRRVISTSKCSDTESNTEGQQTFFHWVRY